ncbi:uncharacterized protein LOC123380853 [Felis catus]|uniref:uncharacterized protein LOC123380853 n=1 Tax=Felis catus TaxID=9685 RepID=UPI001D1A06F2|nr:uncharacterized protein LOC123380853 [Felis catus]
MPIFPSVCWEAHDSHRHWGGGRERRFGQELPQTMCPAGIGSGTAGESAEGLRAGGGPSGARGSWGLRAVVPRPLPLVGGKAPSTRAREPTHVSPPAWGLGLPRPVPRRPRARSNVPSPRGGPEQLRLAWGSGCGASPLPRGLNRGSCCQRIWCHARPARGHYPRPLHQRAVGVFGRTGSTASNYSVGCWLLFHVDRIPCSRLHGNPARFQFVDASRLSQWSCRESDVCREDDNSRNHNSTENDNGGGFSEFLRRQSICVRPPCQPHANNMLSPSLLQPLASENALHQCRCSLSP